MIALVASALLLVAALAPAAWAVAPVPASGSAVVDGDAGEWTATDYFADMSDNGDPENETLATISVRYDCDTETLYALVMATSGNEGLVKQDRPDQAYIRIDGVTVVRASNGADGTPPDFAWVNGTGTRADGYEASADLAPGSYTLRAHFLLEFDDSDGYLTVDTVPREAPLTIDCPEPTPTPTPTPSTSVAPTASASVAPSTSVAPTASASVAPSTSVAPTATPAGTVGGATGTPRTTLPPTDTLLAGVGPDQGSGGLRLAYLLMAGILASLALLTPARAKRHGPRG